MSDDAALQNFYADLEEQWKANAKSTDSDQAEGFLEDFVRGLGPGLSQMVRDYYRDQVQSYADLAAGLHTVDPEKAIEDYINTEDVQFWLTAPDNLEDFILNSQVLADTYCQDDSFSKSSVDKVPVCVGPSVTLSFVPKSCIIEDTIEKDLFIEVESISSDEYDEYDDYDEEEDVIVDDSVLPPPEKPLEAWKNGVEERAEEVRAQLSEKRQDAWDSAWDAALGPEPIASSTTHELFGGKKTVTCTPPQLVLTKSKSVVCSLFSKTGPSWTGKSCGPFTKSFGITSSAVYGSRLYSIPLGDFDFEKVAKDIRKVKKTVEKVFT